MALYMSRALNINDDISLETSPEFIDDENSPNGLDISLA